MYSLAEKQTLLTERIALRLADLAHSIAQSFTGFATGYKDELLNLNKDSFQVIYDLHNYKDAPIILNRIEQAVNDNTNKLVKATEGEFSFGDDFLGMFEDGVTNLITFDPSNCKTSRERFAALMVVQGFESLVQNTPNRIPGRLNPAGLIIGSHYGVIEAPGFDAFASAMNGALEKHALPENYRFQVFFDDVPRKNAPNKGNAPSSPAP